MKKLREIYDRVDFWMSMLNVMLFMAIGRAIPPFLAIIAAGAVFRALGWWQ